MSRWQWLISRLARQLWVRTTLFGVGGVLAAILAATVERYLPWDLPDTIGADSVGMLLSIIASSMLAVTTFSLNIMVSAYSSAAGSVSPRATSLMMEDRLTQTVLSTFIGSFLFSIVGLIVMQTGAYGERGRFVLFVITIFVIAWIVVALLRWIDHLTHFGRLGETTNRVESAAAAAIERWLKTPHLGGAPWVPDVALPVHALPIAGDDIGYVQHIDMTQLQDWAEEHHAQVYLAVLPGTFLYPGMPLAWVALDADAPATPEQEMQNWPGQIRQAFAIEQQRSFDQDPRFGLVVMSEVASRALSPAVNDPGTAIEVIGRLTRLLALWAAAAERAEGGKGAEDAAPAYPLVHVPPLREEDLFEDAFMLIGRDGAGMVEIQSLLQKALLRLATLGDAAFRQAALAQADMALERALQALPLEQERQRVQALAQTWRAAHGS